MLGVFEICSCLTCAVEDLSASMLHLLMLPSSQPGSWLGLRGEAWPLTSCALPATWQQRC